MVLKRLLSISIAAALVFGLFSITYITASAQTSVSEEILFDISSLGIIKGDENGNYNLDKAVTRAEFSAMLVRALTMDTWGLSAEQGKFYDVTLSDWFYDDVSSLALAGIINGYDDGSFRPDNFVAMEEAVKMMVVALGYDVKASQVGGYPLGYMLTGAQLGLFKNLSLGEGNITRADLVVMIYNSLDVSLMRATYGGLETNYEIDSASTLRWLHNYSNNAGVFSKSEGIVSATAETYLIRPYDNLGDDQVVIDGVIYNVGNTNAYDYFGMKVEFYFSADDEWGPYTLRSIIPTAKNETVEFTEREFVRAEETGVIYYADHNDKISSLKLDSQYVYIRNLRPVYSYRLGDIKVEQGEVKLIDNTGDGLYDVLIIEEFESLLVEKINGNTLYFADGATYRGQGLLRINEDDNDVKYILLNSDGSAAGIDDIAENSLISIVSDANNMINKIYISGETISAQAQEYSSTDKNVLLNGHSYKLESNSAAEINLNRTYDFYLNFRNEIAYVKLIGGTDNYAYVINAAREGAISGNVSLKLIIPGKIYDETEKVSDDEDSVSIPVLKGYNSEIKVLPVRNTVLRNGVRVSADDLIDLFNIEENRLIKYKTNSDDEITDIESPQIIGTDILARTNLKRKYNSHERVFGGLVDSGAFGVMDLTQVICLPDDAGITSDDDYLARIEFNNEAQYSVNGYDVVKGDENAKLIVIRTTMRYDSEYGFDENRIAVLEKVSTVFDEDDEMAVKKLVFWANGEKRSALADEKISNIVSSMTFGDVFKYSLNSSTDKIADIEIISNLVSNPHIGRQIDGGAGIQIKIFGHPVNVSYNHVSEISYRRVDKIEIATDGGLTETEEIDVNVRNPQRVYIIDKRTEEVTRGTTKDIIVTGGSIGGADMVFAYTSADRLRVIVIVRG